MFKVIDPNAKLLMGRFAQKVTYYPGELCECARKNDGYFDPHHTCNQGFFYKIAPVETWIMRYRMDYRYTQGEAGVNHGGSAQFTIPKHYLGNLQTIYDRIHHGDIIVLSNKFRRERDILTKGDGEEKLRALDVQEIYSVSRDGTYYVLGEDYTITEENGVAGKIKRIVWEDDKGPEYGQDYVVEFNCKEQYKVMNDGVINRGTTEEDMAKRVILVLRDYINYDKDHPLDNIPRTTNGDV
jgi:hypothetical protein